MQDEAVAAALGLEVIGPCTWGGGMEAAYARTGDVTRRLSVALQAQAKFFATYRVAEAHAWARATPERLVRKPKTCPPPTKTT